MIEPKKVVVAMSGGVDSSVAAALLVQQGHQVSGMMLRLWSEVGQESYNRCCTPEAMSLAQKVAAKLGIPFYVIDIREPFKRIIVDYFINGYSKGVTPNPCMICNKQIRFGLLLGQAEAMGADYLATGHYARVSGSLGNMKLFRGIDPQKDQSYVLSVLNQDQLSKALFPIGNYPKKEIRDLAKLFNLPVADRADSQDLCFLAGDDYRNFLKRNAPEINMPGLIIDKQGITLGEHSGLANYTIGQRKGLGLSSPTPLYVLQKDVVHNRLIVGTQNDLGLAKLTATNANWISSEYAKGPFRAWVKIRYQSPFHAAMITPNIETNSFVAEFEYPLRDITPGQHAVVYIGEECIVNGVIGAQPN